MMKRLVHGDGAPDHAAPGSVRPAVSERGGPASRTADLTVALCSTVAGAIAVVAALAALGTAVAFAQAAQAAQAGRLSERAAQDREIVYFLQAPESHAFRLYHDYTESRPGVDKYLNVVRQGSKAAEPAARLLDTGEVLKTETLRGDAVTKAGLDIGEKVRPDTEVVVVRFPAVQQGQTIRLRIEETYTDPERYRLDGAELVFDRSLGRPDNAVVLPAGWYLTASSIPAVVSETPDGRIRLDYVNGRPDEIAVLIKARRR